MSRVGKKAITVPGNVTLTITDSLVTAKGPKGEQSAPIYPGITVEHSGQTLQVSCGNLADKQLKSAFGMVRALLANAINGVSAGFVRELELQGVGYRAQIQGGKVSLSLGFSHPVEYQLPKGVDAKVEQSRIVLSSSDKRLLGQVAAEIRAFRPPEPYKGKGVRYLKERVVMKEGKKS